MVQKDKGHFMVKNRKVSLSKQREKQGACDMPQSSSLRVTESYQERQKPEHEEYAVHCRSFRVLAPYRDDVVWRTPLYQIS